MQLAQHTCKDCCVTFLYNDVEATIICKQHFIDGKSEFIWNYAVVNKYNNKLVYCSKFILRIFMI